MKKTIQKFLVTIMLLIFAFFFMMPKSLSYFDQVNNQKNESVQIGEWVDLNAPITPGIIDEYVGASDTIIYAQNQQQDVDIAFYIEQLLYGANTNEVNPTFSGYTVGEMVELVDAIKEFSANFLVFNGTNVSYPPTGTADFVDLDFSKNLLPGEYHNIRNVMQLADLAAAGGNSGPITITFSIEAPAGVDISDYAVELLIDRSPFSVNRPFAYDWRFLDDATLRNTGNRNANNVSLTTLMSSVLFNTRTLIASQNTTYRHTYDVSGVTGNWARFPAGPNVYLNGTNITVENPNTRVGMVLVGQTNGGVSTLEVNITQRSYLDTSSLRIVPLVLSVSRGLAVSGSGDILLNQRSSEVYPVIRFKVERSR